MDEMFAQSCQRNCTSIAYVIRDTLYEAPQESSFLVELGNSKPLLWVVGSLGADLNVLNIYRFALSRDDGAMPRRTRLFLPVSVLCSAATLELVDSLSNRSAETTSACQLLFASACQRELLCLNFAALSLSAMN